jgi:hypothetical protein
MIRMLTLPIALLAGCLVLANEANATPGEYRVLVSFDSATTVRLEMLDLDKTRTLIRSSGPGTPKALRDRVYLYHRSASSRSAYSAHRGSDWTLVGGKGLALRDRGRRTLYRGSYVGYMKLYFTTKPLRVRYDKAASEQRKNAIC